MVNSISNATSAISATKGQAWGGKQISKISWFQAQILSFFVPSLRVIRPDKQLILQMVFSSSCTVYGEPAKVPIDETFPRKAVSPYGNTKLVIEDIMTGQALLNALA